MLLLVLKTLRRSRRALAQLAILFVLSDARAADATDVAGTMPEDYLPALKKILEFSVRNAPTVLLEDSKIAQNEARAMGTNAQRLPSFGGSVSAAANQTAISGNSSTQSRDSGLFYNFSLNQPIFYWGALKNDSDRARIGVLVAEKSYREASRTLAILLRRSYLELIVKKAQLRERRFALELTKNDLERMKENYAAGNASQGEVGGRQLKYEDDSLALERVEVEFAGQLRTFARLAGIGALTEDAIPLEIPKPSYPSTVAAQLLAALLSDGAKSTFAAQVAALEVQEADLNYRIAKVRLLPKFSANAGYSVQNSTTASPTSVSQTGIAQRTVALVGNWTIFDGFGAKAAQRDALATKQLHERELKIATDTALDEAQNLARLLAVDVRAMEMAESRRNLAEAGLTRAKEEIGLGNVAGNFKDAAQLNLYGNETANANARALFLAHWGEFVSLAATDPALNNLPARYAREKR